MSEVTVIEVDQMTERANTLFTNLAGAMMSAMEAMAERVSVAAEKASLQAQVERIRNRMAAFGQVLELVGTQKRALLELHAKAEGPTKALYAAQIEMLTVQETAILQKAGATQAHAQQAVAVADRPRGKREAVSTNGHTSGNPGNF